MELDKAWNEVSLEAVSNCSKRAGICKDEGVHEDYEEDNILLSDLEWCKFKEHVNFVTTSSDYVGVDYDMIVTDYPTSTEITQTMKGMQILLVKC
jgi:hypothetical protein